MTWLGVDFSGSLAQWRRRVTSNVWLATLEGDARRPRVAALAPVQELAGEGEPFERVVALLARGDFAACGIDAPLSMPARLLAARMQRELARLAVALAPPGLPFPSGAALVEAVAGLAPPLAPAKPLRRCERLWQSRGVNVRSTAWCGPRGGAAFTAAALALCVRSGRPVWSCGGAAGRAARGALVEVFPAAQLRRWGLPHVRYDGAAGSPVRAGIVAALRPRVSFGRLAPLALARADALDAVLAALGAVAAVEGWLADPVPPAAGEEGWIAVMR